MIGSTVACETMFGARRLLFDVRVLPPAARHLASALQSWMWGQSSHAAADAIIDAYVVLGHCRAQPTDQCAANHARAAREGVTREAARDKAFASNLLAATAARLSATLWGYSRRALGGITATNQGRASAWIRRSVITLWSDASA